MTTLHISTYPIPTYPIPTHPTPSYLSTHPRRTDTWQAAAVAAGADETARKRVAMLRELAELAKKATEATLASECATVDVDSLRNVAPTPAARLGQVTCTNMDMDMHMDMDMDIVTCTW